MSWFAFNGVSNTDVGVMVERVPTLPSPSKRVTYLTIPGRDGDLTLWDGSYDSFDLAISCGVPDTARLHEIRQWLSGYGWLVVSADPSHRIRARVDTGQIYQPVGSRFRRFSALFRCHPFRYELSPETHVVTNDTITLYNPSVVDAFPTITFDGTIVVNGDTFVAATELTVDAEAMVVTKISGGTTVSATSDLTGYVGDMKLIPGENTIVVTGNATITPNWRWL